MLKVTRFNFINHSISFSIVLVVASLLKVSFILGSKKAFFSGVDIVSPLSGALGGPLAVLAFFFSRYLLSSASPFLFVVRHMPGVFGAWYWGSSSVLIRVVVPVLCMALFLMHPTGLEAFAYSFFWLIPVALYFLDVKSPFAEALGSTFVVHAVGSVIWLYTTPMSAAQWWLLIPIVMVERFVFATIQAGIVQIYFYINNVGTKYNLSDKVKKTLRKLVPTFTS
jgi:hypothetical protein